MKFDLFDMFLVVASAVFGADTLLSPGGVIGAGIGGCAATLTIVIAKRIIAE